MAVRCAVTRQGTSPSLKALSQLEKDAFSEERRSGPLPPAGSAQPSLYMLQDQLQAALLLSGAVGEADCCRVQLRTGLQSQPQEALALPGGKGRIGAHRRGKLLAAEVQGAAGTCKVGPVHVSAQQQMDPHPVEQLHPLPIVFIADAEDGVAPPQILGPDGAESTPLQSWYH